MCCNNDLNAPCTDCKVCTLSIGEWYMVKDHLWPPGAQYLCIGCLEQRLGRKLNLFDFDYCLGNIEWKQSERFANRLNQRLFEKLYWESRILPGIVEILISNRSQGYGCFR